MARHQRADSALDEDAPVEEAMTPGPSTIRPSARLERTVERLRAQDLSSIPVTTSGGQLVGLLLREDGERALAEIGESVN